MHVLPCRASRLILTLASAAFAATILAGCSARNQDLRTIAAFRAAQANTQDIGAFEATSAPADYDGVSHAVSFRAASSSGQR